VPERAGVPRSRDPTRLYIGLQVILIDLSDPWGEAR
jgi:hypothetical protein